MNQIEHNESTATEVGVLFARVILGITFLSPVADRFGLWGPMGTKNVAWGDFTHFTLYTHRLTAVFPPASAPLFSWTATIAETVFGLFLILGFKLNITAVFSGLLMCSFAASMAFALGPEAPINASVLSGVAAAWFLAILPPDRLSLDSIFARRGQVSIR